MDNNTCKSYGTIPKCLCIIHEGIVVFITDKEPFSQGIDEVEMWLNGYTHNKHACK